NTSVMPVKVGDAQGVPTSSVVAGLHYAADNGARVINLSLGSFCPDPTERDAVVYAQSKGALIVASAGNERLAGDRIEYPAGYPGVVVVAATAHDGNAAVY